MNAEFKGYKLEYTFHSQGLELTYARKGIMNRMDLTENSAKLSLKRIFFLIRKKK